MAEGMRGVNLERIINGTGGWTAFGAGRVDPDSLAAAAAMSRQPVDIDAMQDAASRAIARAFGAEAGMVVNCSAAGLMVTAAACMTRLDRARAERLPDTDGLNNTIVLQRAHAQNFGAPIVQMLRMTGARVDEIGWANQTEEHHLTDALARKPAACLYVVVYEIIASAELPFDRFARLVSAARVPLIVDIAGEYDPRPYLDAGADLIIISAHKQLGSLTAGIIAGRAELIAACRIQAGGVGRPGKASKESIASVIAALSRFEARGTGGHDAAQEAKVTELVKALGGALAKVAGVRVEPYAYTVAGEKWNMRVAIEAGKLGASAREVADRLAAGSPSVRVRREHLPDGFFVINPREIDESEFPILVELVKASVTKR